MRNDFRFLLKIVGVSENFFISSGSSLNKVIPEYKTPFCAIVSRVGGTWKLVLCLVLW